MLACTPIKSWALRDTIWTPGPVDLYYTVSIKCIDNFRDETDRILRVVPAKECWDSEFTALLEECMPCSIDEEETVI